MTCRTTTRKIAGVTPTLTRRALLVAAAIVLLPAGRSDAAKPTPTQTPAGYSAGYAGGYGPVSRLKGAKRR